MNSTERKQARCETSMVLRVIGLMFFVLLLTACSKNEDSPEDTQPVINVYVYSPDHPTITRGDVGNVKPINNDKNESVISNLQIWVFEHGSETLVSYYSPETVYNLNSGEGVTYQLKVSDKFSQAFPKPNVDVYVVANAASCGLSLPQNICRDRLEDLEKLDLEHAMIKKSGTIDYFGLENLTKKVPEDESGNPIGLPMSGVLRDVAVTGSAPVFKISSVKLTRAVSKLRFIFSRDQGNTPVYIKNIQLGVDLDSENNLIPVPQIPAEEFLFLKADNSMYHIVEDNYVGNDGTQLLPDDSPLKDGNGINHTDGPLKYAYQSGQKAQDYEKLISDGIEKEELSEVGPYYLRETDKKLCGVITYQIGSAAPKTAKFEMKAAKDFSRNHTWIVYAYYGVDGMQVVSVYSQDWNEVPSNAQNVYNW